ncbi:hypothetical protein [Aeromicrobium sp. 179-A 4D2 NHS]|uniref:hypothetical protein n=1 Tax=Aeromicrobium sp. 179-A 4D2 NHS TaxID=3142375 RepID=UPI00399F8B6E
MILNRHHLYGLDPERDDFLTRLRALEPGALLGTTVTTDSEIDELGRLWVKRKQTWKMIDADRPVEEMLFIEVTRIEESRPDGRETDVTIVHIDGVEVGGWEEFWLSDDDYPFWLSDTGSQRISETLHSGWCDLIEKHTGLDMSEARRPVEVPAPA